MNARIPNKTRREVYRRDGYRCCLCDSGRYLQIHHYQPRGKGGCDHPMNLVTLCSTCHAQIHGSIPLPAGFDRGEMQQSICEYLGDYYAPDWYPWDG